MTTLDEFRYESPPGAGLGRGRRRLWVGLGVLAAAAVLAVWGLGALSGAARIWRLTADLGSRDQHVRQAAALEFEHMGAAAAPVLIRLLEDRGRPPTARGAAAVILARIGEPAGAGLVARAALDPEQPRQLRMHCAEALALFGDNPSLRVLFTLAVDPDEEELAAAAAAALAYSGNPRAALHLGRVLGISEFSSVKLTALAGLGGADSLDTADAVAARLGDDDPEVRLAAVTALLRIGGLTPLDKLGNLKFRDPDPRVRAAAADALELISAIAPREFHAWVQARRRAVEKGYYNPY